MKKWFRFFTLSFFSHKISREGTKRGYTNIFLGFVLALIFLWAGFVGGDMLPFGIHYKNAPDFASTVRGVFANADAEIENGILKVKKSNSEYAEGLLVNTFENDADKQTYSAYGYNVVMDFRPADTLAEVEAYCISNDGKETIITYQEYLTLSDVARLNFEFKLRYTGNALALSEDAVESFRAYIDGLDDQKKGLAEALDKDLVENKITQSEYNRSIYELYFSNYYPAINAYESTSKVPLLRNYYHHAYISNGIQNYLFIFNDYMTGSFETKSGMDISFYGFYSEMENGPVIPEGAAQDQANRTVDSFVKNAFQAVWFLYAYSYAVNIFILMPFIALMLFVAVLLAYSILKLRGVESITSLGAVFKIVGSYMWFSGAISAVISTILAFFVQHSIMSVLPFVLFFSVLVIRAVIFVSNERVRFLKEAEQQEAK